MQSTGGKGTRPIRICPHVECLVLGGPGFATGPQLLRLGAEAEVRQRMHDIVDAMGRVYGSSAVNEPIHADQARTRSEEEETLAGS